MRYVAALSILSFWGLKLVAGNGNNEIGQNALLLFPTIPMSHKGGSNTRTVDAAKSLTKLGFQVDLMFWRDFATELTALQGDEMIYGNSKVRQDIIDAGITEIIGPYDDTETSTKPNLHKYDAVFFWPWPDPSWLSVLKQVVDAIKSSNGHTQVVAMVDNPGLAVRNLWENAISRDVPTSIVDVQDYLLTKRKLELLGSDQTTVLPTDRSYKEGQVADGLFDTAFLEMTTNVLIEEQYLYTISDVVVGINSQTQDFLKKMVPGTPFQPLGLLSPVTPLKEEDIVPFSDRDGLIFFGVDDPATNMSLSWFVREVMPHVTEDLILQVVGPFNVPDVCNCDANGSSCNSLNPQVVCHGLVDDKKLDEMIKSALVAVNPALSTADASTHTCRALAYGTPVVVSDNDGTFGNMPDGEIGAGVERCYSNDPDKVLCFALKVSDLATSKDKWSVASKAGPLFAERTYGLNKFDDSWASIIRFLREKPINVVIEGNAFLNGPSLSSQNWYITQTLRNIKHGGRFKVRILGFELYPAIDGVEIASDGFETGYQADIVIRQAWPTPISPCSPSYCGVGCRVATILPWEFGSLPSYWMPILQESADKLWAPSEYNRKIFDYSGWDPSRSSVISGGVDCDELFNKPKTKKTDGKITFVTTGGLLPRKGFDIALEVWSSLFCNIQGTRAELVISSGYEYGGYTDDNIRHFEDIVNNCENRSIKWDRGAWLSRDRYVDLINNADFYLAPFRSEGFGISIAEAAVLSTSVIANFGSGAAADDYLDPIKDHVFENGKRAVYPLTSESTVCNAFPCREDSVCVFENFAIEDPCQKLVHNPTWSEVSRSSLKKAFENAYNDAIKAEMSSIGTYTRSKDIEKICWSEVGKVLDEKIHRAIAQPLHRGKEKSVSYLLAGLLKNPVYHMSPKTLDLIVEMNCIHSVMTHIVVETGGHWLRSAHNKKVKERFPRLNCARLHIAAQPKGLSSNRVQRISEIREYQKSQIRELVPFVDPESAVVILVDFDISSFPQTHEIVKHAEKMMSSSSFPDVLCANGEIGHDDEAGRYYDSFATVLLPDTFVMPIEYRRYIRAGPEEDTQFILSADDREGAFTRFDLFRWFQKQGRNEGETELSPVPVRSCFGGLALLRASKFIDKRCTYFGLPETAADSKYIGWDDDVICEHVLWNNCMKSVDNDFNVAVQPDLVTTWRKSAEEEQARIATKEKASKNEVAAREEGSNTHNSEYAHGNLLKVVHVGGVTDDELSEYHDGSSEDIVLKSFLDEEKDKSTDFSIFLYAHIFLFFLMLCLTISGVFKQMRSTRLGNKMRKYHDLGQASPKKSRIS